MLSAIFFLTSSGELIAYKELVPIRKSCDPLGYGLLFKTNKDVLPIISKKDEMHYIYSEQDKVVVVAAIEDNKVSAFMILESLHMLSSVLRDLIGVLNPQALRENVALLYETIEECFIAGMPGDIETSTLRSRLCCIDTQQKINRSRSADSMSSLATSVLFRSMDKKKNFAPGDVSQKPVFSSPAMDKRDEIFVDLYEQLVMLIDSSGTVQFCEIKGSLEIKSCLEKSAKVVINFSQQSQTYLELARLHPKVKRSDKNETQLQMVADPGSLQAFTFFSPKYNTNTSLPFTMYSHTKPHADGKTIIVDLKIHCALSSSMSALKFTGILPLPSNMTCCTGKSSLFKMNFKTDNKNSCFIFSCPQFPSDSHHSVVIQIGVTGITPATALELNGVIFQFEATSFSPSHMRIASLHVQPDRHESLIGGSGSSTSSFDKWSRHLTYTDSYRFLFDNSKWEDSF